MNPFLITGYKSPEYFCDREKETKRLIESLINHRNVTLFSRRRIGKTALILHTFYQLRKGKKNILIYIDLYATRNQKEFTELFANAVINEFESGLGRMTEKLKNLISSLRPTITYDQFTGNPVFSFTWETEKNVEITIENMFSFLNSQKKEVIIAFDEFQQIVEYPQKNMEAIIRTNLQNSPNVTCVFSGSQDHLMISMFKDKSKPFYQSGELMHLEKIDSREYEKFITYHFKKGKKEIDKLASELILNICEYHTFFVQYLCNRLYSTDTDLINQQVVYDTLLVILKENETFYFNYKNLLTNNQWNLLSAIAKENGIKQITSKDFIKKYDLNTPSSIKTALDVLLKNGLVYFDTENYVLEDVLFKIWLQRI
ncbi:MAG TPA: ATP-binding protein [Ignavibacteria bacterium]|nr:ATP-binding protein [Ignavibacteria bacterium]